MIGIETLVLLGIYFISLYFSLFLFLSFLELYSEPKEELVSALSDFPFVSILIPAYNEQEVILKTLESVCSLNYPKDKLEVIVIDDGSTDNTLTIINDFVAQGSRSSFMRVLSHSNKGKAASMNIALSSCKGEYFACLDADSFVEEDTLQNMLLVYAQEDDDDLAIITPAMKVSSPQSFLQRLQWIEYLVMILLAKISSFLDSIYVAPGPFSLYKTKIIQDLGGFDEHTVAEDQEIAYRVQQQQFRIKHCPTGYVNTTAPLKLYPFYRQRRRWYIGSMQCAYKYRNIIGNLSYGDFGVIQMAMNLFGFLFGIAAVFLSIQFLFIPLWEWFLNSLAVGFDFIPYLLTLDFSFQYFLLNLELLLPFALLFVLAIFFFVMSHKNSSERLFRYGYLEVIPYFFIYFILIGGILLLSSVEFGIAQKPWRIFMPNSPNDTGSGKTFKW